MRLHYIENGDPSKAMILFLHGFPEFWYSWRHQMIEFSKDFYTVALDLRGYGESDLEDKNKNCTIDRYVAEIKAFIESLSTDPVMRANDQV